MKVIEQKCVMYEANDGEIFNTAEECELHELINRIDEVKTFDENFLPSSYDDCQYLVIREEDDVKIVKAFCEHYGVFSPWDCQFGDVEPPISEHFRGILVYENECWYSLAEQIEKLTNNYNRIWELCSQD